MITGGRPRFVSTVNMECSADNRLVIAGGTLMNAAAAGLFSSLVETPAVRRLMARPTQFPVGVLAALSITMTSTGPLRLSSLNPNRSGSALCH